MNKNYTFESVQSNNSADEVELHQKHHSFHILAKIMCFLLAVLVWLLMNGLDIYRNKTDADATAKDAVEQQSQEDITN
jgi:hypothetical protein